MTYTSSNIARRRFDVVIVGAGGSGMRASLQLARAGLNDLVISKLIAALQSKQGIAPPKEFSHIFAELSIENGCVVRGHRIVIPKTLQSQVVRSLHQGHFGTTKMKSLAREHVWWVGIDSDLEGVTRSCPECIRHASNPPKAPVHFWEPAQGPWERVHMDFAGPFQGHNFLILVDAHSKWVEAFIMKETTTSQTIARLQEVFARFGYTRQVVTDNGPQFRSGEFESYLRQNAIQHKLSAPFHPATNGLAERMVRTLKQGLKKMPSSSPAYLTGNLQQLLQRIRNQRSEATGRAPAELLLGRKLRDELSIMHEKPDEPPPTPQNTKFIVGSHVAARMYGRGDRWIAGRVHKVLGPRNYLVKVSGRIHKRHQNQLCLVSALPVDNLLSEFLRIESLLDSSAPAAELLDSTVSCTDAAEPLGNTAPSPRASPPPGQNDTLQPDTLGEEDALRRSSRQHRPPKRFVFDWFGA